MLSREVVGMRIRAVRTQQHKTLRDVESASGFSSTHISEIERGRTSPTIGALIQIAHALEKDPSYFIEERELDEVSVTMQNDRPAVDPQVFDMEGTGIQVESLTHGILGGRIQSFEITLEPGAAGVITALPEHADVCLVCLEGAFALRRGEQEISFGMDDSVHAHIVESSELLNPMQETARIFMVLDPGMNPA